MLINCQHIRGKQRLNTCVCTYHESEVGQTDVAIVIVVSEPITAGRTGRTERRAQDAAEQDEASPGDHDHDEVMKLSVNMLLLHSLLSQGNRKQREFPQHFPLS